VKKRRHGWHGQLAGIDLQKLVFLDESGAKTDMACLRGKCDKSERLRTYCPPVTGPLDHDRRRAVERPVRRRGGRRRHR